MQVYSIPSGAPAVKLIGRWAPLLLVLAVATVISLRDIGNINLGYADADRILMDGVFVMDFLRDLPLARIYDYTINYYAQYPALSIGYRPPFLPFIEGLFNLTLGPSMVASRLALLAFWVVGVSAWFALVRRAFDTSTAFWSALLLVTTPFVAKWGWYTMGELAVLAMVLATAYVFYRYTETDRPFFLYLTALLFSLAAWTKQTAVFMALWFLLYLGLERKLLAYLKRREVWVAIAIVLVMLAPLAAITLWLGDQNIAQSVGTGSAASPLARLTAANLTRHLHTLVDLHLTLPVLVLSVIGLALSIWRGDRRAVFFVLLIVGTYLFFTYLGGKNERYPIFWIPAFAVFAALPLLYMADGRRAHVLGSWLMAVIAGYQITLAYATPPNYATGYDAAAKYVLTNSKSPTVFVDAYNNGYFTYFMRVLDPKRSMYVLRADKLLSSSSIVAKHWLEVHARSREDIRRIVDDYGVTHIVVESEDRSGVAVHQELRDFLREGPFDLVHKVPVLSNREPLEGQELLIYAYQTPKPVTADHLELRLPVVGQTIRVPFRALAADGAAP